MKSVNILQICSVLTFRDLSDASLETLSWMKRGQEALEWTGNCAERRLRKYKTFGVWMRVWAEPEESNTNRQKSTRPQQTGPEMSQKWKKEQKYGLEINRNTPIIHQSVLQTLKYTGITFKLSLSFSSSAGLRDKLPWTQIRFFPALLSLCNHRFALYCFEWAVITESHGTTV